MELKASCVGKPIDHSLGFYHSVIVKQCNGQGKLNADLLLLKRIEVVELEGVTGGIVGFLRPLPHRPPPDHAPTTPDLYRLSQLEDCFRLVGGWRRGLD